MDYHQSIAATCEQTVVALSHALGAHGYRLERSFDLHSARHAAMLEHDQYLVLLAYEQTAPTSPVVITAHECGGLTHLSAAAIQPGEPLTCALLTALDEIWDNLP